jgi:cytochrome c6
MTSQKKSGFKLSTLLWAMFFATLCLGVAGVLSGCATSSPTGTAVPPETSPLAGSTVPISDGQTLFQNHCAGCHAQGGNSLNPAKPVKGSAYLSSVAAFTGFVRQPSGAMPAFDEGALSTAEVKQMYDYVKQAFASDSKP